ncbi:lipocalin family protein [Rhodoferax sp.]|uniref:lipocalin family protein n=1 Tax=Rhodoferax sp. TaxID=50421 RepID=UPI00374CEAD7
MNPVSALFRLALIWLCLLGLAACSTDPPPGVQPVTPFDVQRYAGKWFEIARLEHSFEAGLDNVSAQYRLLPDGSVEVINRGFDAKKNAWKESTGTAKFTGDTHRGSLKVSFFGPFYGGYHVVALDPDYRWAMVVGTDRSYAWILARDKQLPAEVRTQLLEQARKLNIAVDKLVWVAQTRDDS